MFVCGKVLTGLMSLLHKYALKLKIFVGCISVAS